MRGVTDYLPLAVDQDPNSERNKEARRLRERIHTRQRCAFFCLCLLVPGAVILAVQALWSSNRVAGEWKPEPRRDVPGWRHLHQEYVREAREFSKDLQLVLYGDSLVESWRGTSRADPVSRAEGIPEVWNEKFGQFGKTAIALGISGDYTKHLTWRLQHGEVADGMSPAVVVLLIGTNDLSECELLLDDCSVDEIAPEVAQHVVEAGELLHKLMPESRIVLHALLPRSSRFREVQDEPDEFYEQPSLFSSAISTINEALMEKAGGSDWASYLDCSDRFLTEDKSHIDRGLMPDGLHPGKEGAKEWAECLVPAIRDLMG